jgi:tetratricopeptide (TPR) repeat protein
MGVKNTQDTQVTVFDTQEQKNAGTKAIALQNQGVVLLNEEKYAEAKVVAQENVALREKNMGTNSLWTATAYLLLGQIETELKNFEKGLELCKRSASIRDKNPGHENDAACARQAILRGRACFVGWW